MDLTPTRDAYNPVLKRREIVFYVEHGVAATPKLLDARKLLAARYNAREEQVFVRKLQTSTGTTKAVGEAEIYDSVESARSLVPKHIVARNLPDRHKASEERESPNEEAPKK